MAQYIWLKIYNVIVREIYKFLAEESLKIFLCIFIYLYLLYFSFLRLYCISLYFLLLF